MPRRFDWPAWLATPIVWPPLALGIARRLSPASRPGASGGPEAPDLGSFFENTADPLLAIDPGHVILDANAAAARFLSVPRERLRGASVLEVDLLARLLTAGTVLQRLKTGPSAAAEDVTVSDAEGQPIQCRVEAVPAGGGRVLLHLQDTTALLRAREALRAAERLHHAADEVLPGVAWTMALPEERLLEIGPAVEGLFGHQPAAFRERPELWEELVHPADRERWRAEFRAGVASGRPFEIRFTGLHRDRRDLPHLVSHVAPVADERGWVDRCHGLIRDESAGRAMEARLQAAEAHLRHVLDSVTSGVLVVEPGGRGARVALCNRRLADVLRLDEPVRPDTSLAQAPEALRALARGARPEPDFERRLLSEDVQDDVTELDLGDEDAGASRRMLRRYAGPVRDAYGGVIGRIVTVEDVTASWLLQRRLTQAQKMESMGRLAGGIAHDFNNLLGSVLGFASLLLDQTPPDDPRRSGLAQIAQAAERASRLTAALLAFSRAARFERMPVDLNRVVEDSYQLLRSTLDPSVAITLELAPSLPPLLGDALLLQQAVVNLVQEVRERLAAGGSLRLVTRTREVAAAPGAVPPPRAAALDIEVSAAAREPETAGRDDAARPERPGLGLTIAEDIARAHGGTVVSGPEAAPAAFRLELPVGGREDPRRMVPEEATARGHERILVVDDEPALRLLARTGLRQRGFDVLTADSGEQALEILRSGEPVDLVFLDLSLPGLSGERVLRAIRDFRPDLPVIIASGYATVESQAAWSAAGAQGFIGKPYRIADVAARLREVLDRTHGRVL